MNKIEHLGIAVKNLEQSNALFAKLLGKQHYKIEAVKHENVRTSFFMAGNTKIELLEAMNEQSAIAKFIEKRGEGLHHIAFAVDDIYAEMKRLENMNIYRIFSGYRCYYWFGYDNSAVIHILFAVECICPCEMRPGVVRSHIKIMTHFILRRIANMWIKFI